MSCSVALSFVWRGTDSHFVKVHKIYRQKSKQDEHVLDSLSNHLPSAMEKIYPTLDANQAIKILSIGSGDGKMDIEILKIMCNGIKRKFPALSPVMMLNRVVEPNENHLEIYKIKASNLPRELPNAQITFDMKPTTFEEYSMLPKDSVQFDVIHLLHAAYFLTDLERSLRQCYDVELAEHGVIVLVIIGQDDTIALIKQRFFNVTDLVCSKMARIAAQNGWNHEVHSKEYTIDVTEIFDQHSLDGNLLLDFLTHSMDFRTSGKPEKVESVLETIRNNSTVINGKILAKRIEETHFIFK